MKHFPDLMLSALMVALCATSPCRAAVATIDLSSSRPAAANQSFYHGETILFQIVDGKNAVSNIDFSCVYYQTNGMGQTWWKTDSLVFHPTNDIGAAQYRFFLDGRDETGRNWHANGLLRFLDSPGFAPNTLAPPVQSLDFALVNVANPERAPFASLASLESIDSRLSSAETNLAAKVSVAGDTMTGELQLPWFKTTHPSIIAGRQYGLNGVSVGGTFQQFPNKSGTFALLGDIAAASTAATNYADRVMHEFNNIGYNNTEAIYNDIQDTITYVNEAQYTADSALDSATEAAAAVSSLATTVAGKASVSDVYRIVAGTNVVLVVTNYNSAVHAPLMSLQHLDPESGEYVTYWMEARRHGMTLTNAMNYTDAAILTRAPAAWSGTTSGLGQEAPQGVTWISTPETVIAGGFEYEKVVTSSGAVWILTSNGLTTGATTNSFFKISASDGTELFSIEKTDSYLVGVDASGISRAGDTVTISLPVVAPNHPFIRATTNIVNAVWTKEDENGFSCPFASVAWSGTTGNYTATVTCNAPQAFFYFEYLQEGSAKIKQTASTELSGGIYFNGTLYFPRVNGSKLEFVAQ